MFLENVDQWECLCNAGAIQMTAITVENNLTLFWEIKHSYTQTPDYYNLCIYPRAVVLQSVVPRPGVLARSLGKMLRNSNS